ncbi:MAG: 30S ribosome-binding factor RbfA [Janthinobacterium lividum]
MPATRKQRLQDQLREVLSEVIRREMRDPRFQDGLLSITDVEVTSDYKNATIFISVLGSEEAKRDKLNLLRGANGVLREALKKSKAFINVPSLTFKYDDTIDRGSHMFEVLEQVKREDAARPKPLAEETDADEEAKAEEETE